VLGRQSLRWLRPYWRQTVPILAAIVVEVGYWTLVPLALRWLIDAASSGGPSDFIVRLLVMLGCAYVVCALVSTARMALTARLGARLLGDARLRLFEHLQQLPARFFARTPSGDLVSRFTTDLNAVENGLTFGLPEVIWGAVQIAVAVPLLYSLNLGMALVATVSVPLALAGSRLLAGPVDGSGYRRRRAEGELQAAAEEQIAGYAVVRAFGLEQYMLLRLNRQLGALGALTARDNFLTRLVGRSTVFGAHLGQLVLYAVGVALIARGELTVGTFVGFVGLLLNVGEAIRSLSVGLPAWLQATGPMRRVDEVLAEQPLPADSPTALTLSDVRGSLELRQASFGYEGRQSTLVDLNLAIPAGTRLAVVGASGSGKSTLLGLLTGALEPDRGAVLLDGHDRREVLTASWRAQMAVVPPQTFLFSGSVADNIRLGRPAASDADLRDAARAAQLHLDIVSNLPDGYDTQVGEHGANLSSGQAQRIALARAILRQAPILLLDEATSSLDPRTEAEFMRALAEVARGRTVVSVTHRLGTVVDADCIAVLRGGRLVQQGSHVELLEDEAGEYARLWAHQHGFGLDGRSASVTPERLREIPLFRTLPLTLLEGLAGEFVTRTAPSGEVVIAEGELADTFFIIVRGTVDVSAAERHLATLHDGDAFGEIALLGDIPRTATVRTRTECVLLALDIEHFQQLLAEAPEVASAVRDMAAARQIS
jgi:ATP-binding cassette subfamily B protein